MNSLNTQSNLVIEMGRVMISFNHRTPEVGREILYLLGNGIDGVTKTCTLVRGIYDPKFGDFSRDEQGQHLYSTHWTYIKSDELTAGQVQEQNIVKKMEVFRLLEKMMQSDKELYERILDTPGFAFHFNELTKLASK